MGDKSVVDVLGRDSIIHGLKDVIFMLSENREGKVFALDGKCLAARSALLSVQRIWLSFIFSIFI